MLQFLQLAQNYYGAENGFATGISSSGSILLMIAIAVAGYIVQARLQSVFAKYSQVGFPGNLTGAEVAEKMLRDNGITDVRVTHVSGELTDHFNPANKTVNLSDSVYESNSVAAAAVAAHECGHAVQHAVGYTPLKWRSALVPVTSFSSKFAILFIIGGIVLAGVTNNLVLFWIGIGMIAMSALFSIVTLPVEYNASHRALVWLENEQILNSQQQAQAKEALTWAARTYLVAALSAIATLIYYIGFARRD